MLPARKGSGSHRTSLCIDVDGEQVLQDLDKDIGVMQDCNEDIAHDNLEDEMVNVVNEINEATAGTLGTLTPMHKETLFLMKKVHQIHFNSSRITDGVCWAMQVVGFACALCRSDMKTTALFECCEHENIKPCRPVKVVETHWNSHIAALD